MARGLRAYLELGPQDSLKLHIVGKLLLQKKNFEGSIHLFELALKGKDEAGNVYESRDLRGSLGWHGCVRKSSKEVE